MAITHRRSKEVIEGIQYGCVTNMIKIKDGEENRFRFPIRKNIFYQLALEAKYKNERTGEIRWFGKHSGRNARSDFLYSRQSQKFNYQHMFHECIGTGYQRANTGSAIAPGDTDPDLYDNTLWKLHDLVSVYVQVNHNVRLKKDGTPRKVKPTVLHEKKNWKKTQVKLLAKAKKEKKATLSKKYVTPKKTSDAWKKLQARNKAIAKRAKARKNRK